MRRSIAFLLALVMVLSLLTACGGEQKPAETNAPEVEAAPVGNFIVPEGGYDGSAVEIVFYNTMGANLAAVLEKYIAEFIGTLTLVTLGCGTAMLVGCNAAAGSGYLLTALAFGLVIVGMAYCVGNISGCHINPAVSLGVLINGGVQKTVNGGGLLAGDLGKPFGGSARRSV